MFTIDSSQLAARALRPLSRSGAILCYHGIAASEQPSSLHVTARALQAAAAVAQELGEIIPLMELLRRHNSGRSTAGLFSFTFDDAYLSLETIAEFIETAHVPITVFAVSDALDDGRRFWWDRLEAVLARASSGEIEQLADAFDIPAEFRERHRSGWGLGRPFRQWLIARYAARWPRDFDEPLRNLEAKKEIAPGDRSMTWDELTRFLRSEFVSLGVHTASHAAMPLISQEDQEREITVCFERLRERFPDTIPVLAAPFGLYDRSTVDACRASGMHTCLTLGARTLRFHGVDTTLPRFCILPQEQKLKIAFRLAGVIDRVHSLRGQATPGYPQPPTLANSDDSEVIHAS